MNKGKENKEMNWNWIVLLYNEIGSKWAREKKRKKWIGIELFCCIMKLEVNEQGKIKERNELELN